MSFAVNNAVDAADLVAKAVWHACAGPAAFGWRDALGKSRADVLAQFVAARPDARAEDLYRFAVASDPAARHWAEIPPALRCAVEVFRATFLVLYRETTRAAGRLAEGVSAAPRKEPAREIVYGGGRGGRQVGGVPQRGSQLRVGTRGRRQHARSVSGEQPAKGAKR